MDLRASAKPNFAISFSIGNRPKKEEGETALGIDGEEIFSPDMIRKRNHPLNGKRNFESNKHSNKLKPG